MIIRQVTRRTGTAVSYKEESEEGTDSDDLVEVEESNAVSTETDNAETIERILDQRIGKKEGTILGHNINKIKTGTVSIFPL